MSRLQFFSEIYCINEETFKKSLNKKVSTIVSLIKLIKKSSF